MIDIVSLFSGIGGFELGFIRASKALNINTRIVFSSEIDKHTRKVYINHFGEGFLHGDIEKTNAADVPKHDILCAGFPCQDVSISGKRAGLEGSRSGLFNEITRILRKKKPGVILLENVKGLLNVNGGWDFAKILIELESIGYICEWQILNTKYYLPQNRERVYIIGHLATTGRDIKKIFPIGENRKQDNKISIQSTNTITTRYGNAYGHGSYIIECKQSDPGVKQDIITHSLYPRSGDSTKGGTGHLYKTDNTSYCLDCGNTQAIELPNNKIRKLTPIECERLQGFPDNWTALLSDTQRYKCLGNAVSVPVIEDIAIRILKTLT